MDMQLAGIAVTIADLNRRVVHRVDRGPADGRHTPSIDMASPPATATATLGPGI
jgi:hypothetical protein